MMSVVRLPMVMAAAALSLCCGIALSGRAVAQTSSIRTLTEEASLAPLPADTLAQLTERQYESQYDSVAPVTGNQSLQIKVTPVDIDREKPEQPVMHYYDKHGEELETPVRFLTELDTVTSVKPGPKYPLYNGTSVGVNVFDFIMVAAGQRRWSADISAEVSLWNWLSPVVEVGLGYANAWPEDGRCRVRTNPTLYGKLGFNYNFLYKGNPDYQLYAGFRAAYTGFRFSVTNIQAGSEYLGVADGADLAGVKATCWYGQAVLGIRVKVWKHFCMGWSGRIGFKFRTRTSMEGVEPWFIPGYGTGALSATYSLIWNF